METKTITLQTESLLAKMLLSFAVNSGDNGKDLKREAAMLSENLGGEDLVNQLLDFGEQVHEALVSACVDMVVYGILQEESKTLFAKLPPAQKICAENLFFQMTGQSVIQKRMDMWSPFLWKIKNFVKEYRRLSPSKISNEELSDALKKVGLEFLKESISYFRKLL